MAKRNGKRFGSWSTLLVLCAIAVGLWLLLQNRPPELKNDSGHKYQVHKTGAGVTIDFVRASREIDAVILKTVKSSGFKSGIGDSVKREAPRTKVEGTIKWENRHITLSIPTENQMGKIEDAILNSVQQAGGRILSKEEDVIEGKAALRMNFGIVDTLEGESVTLTTHNIWLIVGAEVPVAPPPIEKNVDKGMSDALKDDYGKTQEKGRAAQQTLGRLALIIDDFGLTMEGVSELMSMDRPMTFAILPYHTYSASIAREAVNHNKQVLLHLPMESLSGDRSEASTILTTMNEGQIREKTEEAISTMPQIIGVNNHQGSKATANSLVMKAALATIRDKGLFFVDSRTNAGSVAYQTARNMGVHTIENNHFIDNTADVAAIKEELRFAGRLAIQYGDAVAIGHIRPHTVSAIRVMIPELEAMGVKLVFVSELVN